MRCSLKHSPTCCSLPCLVIQINIWILVCTRSPLTVLALPTCYKHSQLSQPDTFCSREDNGQVNRVDGGSVQARMPDFSLKSCDPFCADTVSKKLPSRCAHLVAEDGVKGAGLQRGPIGCAADAQHAAGRLRDGVKVRHVVIHAQCAVAQHRPGPQVQLKALRACAQRHI